MKRLGAHHIAAGAAVGALALSGAVLGVVSGQSTNVTVSPVPIPHPEPDRGSAVRGCGTERAAVKHLTDGFTLPTVPVVMTPDELVNLVPPPISQNSPRLPEETKLVELRDVHVIAVKQEADSDLHVIISTPTGAELNVEAPMAQCDSASPYAGELAAARAAMDAAMPNVSSSGYTPENLTATIEGVLFFDVLHGQRGAPNGVELHPVTFFHVGGGPSPSPPSPPPPPPGSTSSTTTTSPSTSTNSTTSTTPTPRPDSDPAGDRQECGKPIPRHDSDRSRDGRSECG